MSILSIKFFYKKFLFIVAVLFVVIGYGFVVFAAAPNGGYVPGGTLDPDCAPGDVDCLVAISGRISIGDVVGNNPDLNGILYTNSNAQVTTDISFTRNAITKETLVLRDFTNDSLQNNYSMAGGYVIGSMDGFILGETVTDTTSGATAIYSGNFVDDLAFFTNIVGIISPGDTITGDTSGATQNISDSFNSSFSVGQIVNTYVVDSNNMTIVLGSAKIIGISGNLFQLEIISGLVPGISDMIFDDSFTNLVGVTSISTNTIQTTVKTGFKTVPYLSYPNGSSVQSSFITMDSSDGTIDDYAKFGVFAYNENPTVQWGYGNNFFSLPSTIPSLGQTLVADSITDGSVVNLKWGSAGPISVTSNGSLYSSGLSGTNIGADYYNIVLGVDAGSSGSFEEAVFIGQNAGNGATAKGVIAIGQAGINSNNSGQSVFIGNEAGRDLNTANYSNFIGHSAGNGAANSDHSNFLGSNAGYYATNASNSIFIGNSAGYFDTVDNTTSVNDFSILIGKSTSTGGFSNSIAIGGSATNTASNQFMIGSSTRPINTLVLTGASGNTCTLDVTVASPSCSSDERLKTNITDLTSDTLDKVLNIKTVSYNWINFPDKGSQIGFLAQDLEQYFPQVVSEAPNGFKTVSYGGMTPILVEAIREMNLKIITISDMETENTWRDSLIAWFGNTANGITDLYAKVFHADRVETKELCIEDLCVTKSQLQQILNQNQIAIPVILDVPTNTDNLGNDNSLPSTGDILLDTEIPLTDTSPATDTTGGSDEVVVTDTSI